MKTIKTFISIAGLTGGLYAGAVALAAEAPATAPDATTPAPAAAAATDTASNAPAEFPPDKGLRLNFKEVPMETVLKYMSSAGGFIIHPQVSLGGTVTAYSDQPLSKEEALQLVEHVLSDNGYAILRDGNILTVVSSAEAKRKNVPTMLFTRLEDIPNNAEVATWIIPVRTLNPIALVANLRPLIGTETDLQANESANALMVTDSQNNIRRIAEIVMKLDSVSSSINSLEVFPLKYADSKALADLVKQLFPSADTSGGGRGGNGQIQGFAGRGGRGGRGGGGGGGGFAGLQQLLGGGGGADPSGSTPQSRISAVSDDHSNSLIVSAPEDLIPIIRDLVQKLDQPIEDITEVRTFQLQNADCNEMATMLANLFPDPSGTDASSRQVQVGGRGGAAGGRGGAAAGRGGAAFGGGGAAAAGGGESEYMKKQATVSAVPDPRTQSLIVSASKDMMPQIADLITNLDSIDSGKLTVHRIRLDNADPQDVMQLVQDLYPQGSTSTKTVTATSNPLLNRATTLGSSMLSSGPGSGTTSSSGGGGGGRTSTTATGF